MPGLAAGGAKPEAEGNRVTGNYLTESFAGRLRALREARGLSQNALARAAELSPSLVNMLEGGARRPTAEITRRLARALGLSEDGADELLALAGSLPLAFERISPADPDLLLLARVLGDEAIPADERRQLRALIRVACLRWRPRLVDLDRLLGVEDSASALPGPSTERSRG
jgi:transcriptional regulator with XRE-family HTH domain